MRWRLTIWGFHILLDKGFQASGIKRMSGRGKRRHGSLRGIESVLRLPYLESTGLSRQLEISTRFSQLNGLRCNIEQTVKFNIRSNLDTAKYLVGLHCLVFLFSQSSPCLA